MAAAWSTGLCDCTVDIKQCLDNCFCFPCSVSRQLNAIEESKPDTFTLSKCICPGLCHPACVSCYVRHSVVKKYNIDEGLIKTLVLGGFCALCSITQTHRELTKRNCWPGGSCLHSQPGSYDMA